MSYTIDTFDFEHLGVTYRCEVHQDSDISEPWKEYDGHGVVTEWESRDKKPYELILCSDRRSKRFYDLKASMQIAKRDDWGCNGAFVLKPGQRAYRAVMADYEYLRKFCNDQWGYVWINVYPLDSEANELKSRAESLGGIEYGLTSQDEYIRECAQNLAHEIDYKVTA